jgi:acid phosphatase family membrane protein YuiD
MDWFTELLSNRFLLTALSSWFIAQVLKVIINAVIHKKIIWERLVGDGGMPSGHSATVSSLAMMSGLVYGLGSFQFAMAGVLAVIVCHDATGVRMETGKQSMVINEILDTFERMKMGYSSDIVLKEFVGHTPLQVAAGITIGILNALFMYYVVFGA